MDAKQYSQAVVVAKAVFGKAGTGSSEFSFTGHSLGGGLAMQSAMSLNDKKGRKATTFNAAGLALTKQFSLKSRKDMKNHDIVTDPLSNFQHLNVLQAVPGRNSYHIGNYRGLNPVSHHSIDNFRGIWSEFQ